MRLTPAFGRGFPAEQPVAPARWRARSSLQRCASQRPLRRGRAALAGAAGSWSRGRRRRLGGPRPCGGERGGRGARSCGRARAGLRCLGARFPRVSKQPAWSSCQPFLRVTAWPGDSSGASLGTTFLWRQRCLGKLLFGRSAGGIKPSWSCRGPKSGSESFHLKLGRVPTLRRCRVGPKQVPGRGVGFSSQPTERLSHAGANGLVLGHPTARQKPTL